MTAGARPVGEDDLHAYVDGLLQPEERARVDRYLQSHPAAAERVGEWQSTRDALQRAFSERILEPVPSALNLTRLAEERLASTWSRWQVAAAAMLALSLGVGCGWLVRGSDKLTGMAALGQQAAMVQRVLAADSGEVGTGNGATLAGWVQQRLGKPLVVPDLSQAGYALRGGRLVATEAGPACAILYTNSRGQRLTVLVRPMAGSDVDAPVRPIQAADVAGYVWMGAGMAFGIVADRPSPELRGLTETVRREMDPGA